MPKRANPLRKSRVRWFSDKPKGKKRRRSSPRQLVALRLRCFAKYLRDRYGTVLPDDDAGRDDLFVAVNHLACLPHPHKRIENWIEIWAPWLTIREHHEIVGAALLSPQVWTADELAWRIGLTSADRTRLGITTIGAIDENRAARLRRRQTSTKERLAALRHAKGVKPRADYLAKSVEQAEPWKAEGISRRTWFRRRSKANGTGPCAA